MAKAQQLFFHKRGLQREFMTIDTSGKWWIGSDATDLNEYLNAFSSDGNRVDDIRLAKCRCRALDFKLWADDGEGTAQRICAVCGSQHFFCDSEEYWAESTPIEWKCVECGSEHANIGVGFSLYDDGEVRWLYVGERCSSCGVLGWQLSGRSPTHPPSSFSIKFEWLPLLDLRQVATLVHVAPVVAEG